MNNQAYIVFYKFGRGCSTDTKESHRFGMLIRNMWIDCMAFAAWFVSKIICHLCIVSDTSNSYNENGIIFT